MNYTAAASWLVIVAIAMFVISYLPRIAARVQDERAARATWLPVLRAAALAAEVDRRAEELAAIDPDEPDAEVQLFAALADAEATLDQAYAYIAAREAAQLDAEWEQQG